jgi:hypothetical protein
MLAKSRRCVLLAVAQSLVALALAAPAAFAQETDPLPPTPVPEAAPAAPAAEKSLEQLLRDGGYMFTRLENGFYRIAVELRGQVSIVLASELEMNWNDITGNKAKRINVYRWLVDAPEGFIPSRELLEKIDELNLSFEIGRFVRNRSGYLFATGVWLRTADVHELSTEITIAANAGLDFEATIKELVSASIAAHDESLAAK